MTFGLSRFLIFFAILIAHVESFNKFTIGKSILSSKSSFSTSTLFNRLKDEPIPENETEQQMMERLRKKVNKIQINLSDTA